MVFGLAEDENEDLVDTVGELFQEIGLKPTIVQVSRTGNCKKSDASKKTSARPVKISLFSASTASQILAQARKLRHSEKFSKVFLSPDRSIEDRVKQKKLVEELRKKTIETGMRHFIKGGEVLSTEKPVK